MFGRKITKTILIEGMHCGHCSKRVEEALKSLNGVSSTSFMFSIFSVSIITTLFLSFPSLNEYFNGVPEYLIVSLFIFCEGDPYGI